MSPAPSFLPLPQIHSTLGENASVASMYPFHCYKEEGKPSKIKHALYDQIRWPSLEQLYRNKSTSC